MTSSNDQESPILISAEEANSSHVDDLLKRQMSLRGEAGVAREPTRRWYYRNWLLFMIVGSLAALGAWMIIEPYYDDYFYVQGRIESAGIDDVLGAQQASTAPIEASDAFGAGWIRIRGQQIWLSPLLADVSGRHLRAFDPATLRVGSEIGVYTRYFSNGRDELSIASYIDPAPKKAARGKALEPIADQAHHSKTAGFLLFAVVAAAIGLGIGAADGIVCRLPRRALLGGLIGALVGFVGGLFSGAVAEVLYIPLNHIATEQLASNSEGARALGFLLQMIARMFAWTLAGSAMGLGQGIALRSKRLLSYGFLGGIVGGLLGGLLFDPIDMVILGSDMPGAEWSRLISLLVIGAAVGAMIGIVEILTRDAWLRMTEGPLAGKEFLIFRDVMNIGASPRSEIYLFNDDQVAPTHATLRMVGDELEITARDRVHPLLINDRTVTATTRLRHGDRITIGRTSFLLEQRQR